LSATILNIENKHRTNSAGWVNIKNFSTTIGDVVDASVVMQPNISLYCLDHPNRRFIFVETPESVDLSQHPFFFQAQLEYAQRLVAVPYDVLHQMAAQAPLEGEKLILLYSVGRCGSTLLSEVFNQLDDVVSLSEPDVFTEILKMRDENGRFNTELKQLVHSSLFALMTPMSAKRPSHWAIKFRSYAVELADLIYEVVPDAKALFMYRNAVDWARSTARAFQKLQSEKGSVGTAVERKWAARSAKFYEWSGEQPSGWTVKLLKRIDAQAGVLSRHSLKMRKRIFPALDGYEAQLLQGDLSRMEYITLEWVSGMQKYAALYRQDIPMLAFRYEELIAQPEQLLSQILTYSGLSVDDLTELLAVFAQDSQRGTSLARTAVRRSHDNELTETHLAQLSDLLKNHPDVLHPDVILPGTIGIENSLLINRLSPISTKKI